MRKPRLHLRTELVHIAFRLTYSYVLNTLDYPPVTSPQSVKRPRPTSPAPSQISPTRRASGTAPKTPTRHTIEKVPKTPSSAFTPSQKQRRLEHIIAGMAESPQRRPGDTSVPHIPPVCDSNHADSGFSYSATSRSSRRLSGHSSIQGLSNHDEYDGMSLPSPSKRSRYTETGSPYSVGIQTSPRENPLLGDKSQDAVEEELNFTPASSLGSVAGRSRNCLSTAFPLPGSPSQASPSQHRQSMTPGDRSQGYLTPPKSSELQSDERPLSRRGGFAPMVSPAQREGDGRDAGRQPHPQWRFEEDIVSAPLSVYDLMNGSGESFSRSYLTRTEAMDR